MKGTYFWVACVRLHSYFLSAISLMTYSSWIDFPPNRSLLTFSPSSGISGGQTNSDIEALHQAYCHIEQSLGDTDEQKINADKIGNVENLVKDVSQDKKDCPKNTSTTDSGKFWIFYFWLMKHFRIKHTLESIESKEKNIGKVITSFVFFATLVAALGDSPLLVLQCQWWLFVCGAEYILCGVIS